MATRDQRLLSFERSRALHQRARATTPGGVHSNVRLWEQPWPLYFDSGAGSHLRDVDGNDLIDYVLGQGPMLLGHNPTQVIDSVASQIRRGILFGGQHELEIAAAEKLVEMIPSVEKVRFNMTGTEAVQAAIRIARAATGRAKIVKFQGHYDGWADSVLFNTSSRSEFLAESTQFEPVAESPGVSSSVAGDLLVIEWNDTGAVDRVLFTHGKDVAALIMEPVMGNSGVIEPRPGYLQHVRDACTKHNVVLIFDEVITGFRLGPTGAQGLYGVQPDLTVFGKALASGFPVACVAGRSDLFEGVDKGTVMHAGTFNGNPVGLAAVSATLGILSDPESGVYERIESAGRQLRDGLAEIARDHRVGILVQGLPGLFAISFTSLPAIHNHRESSQSDMKALREFIPRLLSRGVRIAGRGNWFLSSVHTPADVNQTLESFEGALQAFETQR